MVDLTDQLKNSQKQIVELQKENFQLKSECKNLDSEKKSYQDTCVELSALLHKAKTQAFNNKDIAQQFQTAFNGLQKELTLCKQKLKELEKIIDEHERDKLHLHAVDNNCDNDMNTDCLAKDASQV